MRFQWPLSRSLDQCGTRLKELAAQHAVRIYRRLAALREREGMAANHKRVYRLYREEGLVMRISFTA